MNNPHNCRNQSEVIKVESKGGNVARIRDKYGNYNGPYRIKLSNYEVDYLAETNSLGFFSGIEDGITCIPDIQKYEISLNDVGFVLVSNEIKETLKDEEVNEALVDGVRSRNVEIAARDLFFRFQVESGKLKDVNRCYHEDFQAVIVLFKN